MSTSSPQKERGAFMARAAEAMLRALGGCEVRLLLPMPVLQEETAQQLGLAAAAIAEVEFRPVVVRNVRAAGGEKHAQYELLFSADTVKAGVAEQQAGSAEDLFAAACGVMVGEKRLRIVNVMAEYFAGSPYMYRVIAAE
jgi:hypothetical protein